MVARAVPVPLSLNSCAVANPSGQTKGRAVLRYKSSYRGHFYSRIQNSKPDSKVKAISLELLLKY